MLACTCSIISSDMPNIDANRSASDSDMRVWARGASALTRMPCAMPSVARLRVRPKTAPLAAP
jgi:hypothetical protein